MIRHPILGRYAARLAPAAAALLLVCTGKVQAEEPATPPSARAVLEASGVKGGLVAVVGCGRPAFLADLEAAGPYLVHGLDADPDKVAAAREHLLRKGLYGPVTVSRLTGAELPYVDGLVNLLVLLGPAPVPKDEMLRVLAPLGAVVDARGNTLAVIRKPRPAELDEWTHFLHDASGNAVSRDTRVGPPQGLRWTCGPRFARSHEHFASASAMVAAGGRLFYIIDEGPIASVYLPPRWRLVARDAASGVLLWKRPISNWESHLRGFRSGPPEIARRLVAVGDRVYAALDYGDPVTVLDAASGRPLARLAGTDGARELVWADGVLYVLADDMTAEEHEARKRWIERIAPTLEIWYRFPRRPVAIYGTPRIVAIHTGSGERLWQRQFKAPGEVMPATLAVAEGRVCVQTVSHLLCLDARTGKEVWRSRRPVARSRFSWSTPTLVIQGGVVLSLDRVASAEVDKSPPREGSEWIISSSGREVRQPARLVAFSLADGTQLWQAPATENYNTPGDVFVIDGTVWVGDLRCGRDPGFTVGRDLKTGRVVATLPPQKGWGHHRCYRNKATVRWILVGRGGTQFVDLQTGTVRNVGWVRGGCQYGLMPAYGLLYAPPHSCACMPEFLLVGLLALSARSGAADPGSGEEDRLRKGPAFGAAAAPSAARPAPHDWPTYRRDARRSGFQNMPAPREPAIRWTARLHPPITAPVAAGGRVFVAETDRHRLHALSATDGRPLWTFTADGRIDSPPTVAGGLCVFGTRSGLVYCLRARDGALVWRLRAAPRDRRLLAYGQLESVWPVHGSVLVDEGPAEGAATVYVAAGRSSFLDGDIHLLALDLRTGTIRRRTVVSTAGGRGGRGVVRRPALPDILSLQKGAVWMRGLGLNKHLEPVEARPHLFAPRGFLDDTWWHRTYWLYGTKIGGGYSNWPTVGNRVPAGRLLVFDGGPFIYGYGRMAYRAGGGHVRPDMAKDYRLFAERLPDAPPAALRPTAPTSTAEPSRAGRRRIVWAVSLPFVARSLVLTSDALLAAGGGSPTDRAERHGPGTLWVLSRKDGSRLAVSTLPAPPVLDGLALTDEGIFVSTIDGTVVCLRGGRGE